MCSVSPCRSVSLSCAIFCSPSAARPSLRQARAPSSNSAALADVLQLTLAHHYALCRHAALASLCPLWFANASLQTHNHTYCHPANQYCIRGSDHVEGASGEKSLDSQRCDWSHMYACVCAYICLCVFSVMSRVQRLIALFQWWHVGRCTGLSLCTWVCWIIYVCLHYVGSCTSSIEVTLVSSSPPPPPRCPACRTGALNNRVYVSTYLNCRNRKTSFFLTVTQKVGQLLATLHCGYFCLRKN